MFWQGIWINVIEIIIHQKLIIMRRYIILSAMLVFALNLSAQTTNPGRATRERSTTGTAVKENKTPEEPKKAEVKKERTESRVTTPATAPQRSETRTTTRTTRSEPANTSAERKSNTSVSPARTRETTTTRTRETTTTRTREANSENMSREVERPANRTISRENTDNRNRTVSPERKSTARRSEGTVRENEYVPRNEQENTTRRRAYTTPERRVTVRPVTNPGHVHRPIEYRRSYYPYRVPSRADIIWDVHLYHHYRYLYPHYDYWYYPIGYRIHTVSAYDADRYIGEFVRIYGRVYEAWFNNETDEVYLYFGEPYPYQDFTVIIAGKDARRYSRRPERYFTGREIAVTGVVSVFEGKPEMVIKRRSQIDFYF